MAESGGEFSFDYKIGSQGAQDRAKQFMGGKIVRGIVELVTNSDAAYSRLGSDRQRKKPSISITVDHVDRYFEVKDRAGGMSPETVEEKFTRGGDTSTPGHRGYFGLGAKDCAVFGSLELHTIDGNGNYSAVNIPGTFQNCSRNHRKAAAEDYEKIHGENRQRPGTAIKVHVNRKELGGAGLPRFETLKRDLRTHYALRSLLKRNKVKLEVVMNKKSYAEPLVYAAFPWEDNPEARKIADAELEVPNYPASRPRLVLYELEESVDGEPRDETFEGFVLVGSGEIADYGFTLAGLESQTQAKRLTGRLDDPYIQELLDDYRTEKGSETNPSPVISQDRRHRNGGLDDSHPYYEALIVKTLRPILQKALQEMHEKGKGTERAGISEALEAANRDAGKLLSDMFDASGPGPAPKPLGQGFYFLPTTKDIRSSDPKWTPIYVYSIGNDAVSGEEVSLHLENPEICEFESDAVRLVKMQDRDDSFRALIRLRANSTPGSTVLRASLNGSSAEATVRVVDNLPPQMEFRFERSKYSVKPGKRRKVRVLVPESLIEENAENSISIHLSDSRDGIVLRSPREQRITECPFDGERIAYVVTFEIEGRRVGAKAELTAKLRELQAKAVITVGGGSIEIYIDDSTKSPPDQRSKVFDVGEPCGENRHLNETCLHVFTRHPRIEPYLGEPIFSEGENIFWNLNDSPGFRAMCADSIAEAAAEFKIMSSMETQQETVPQDLFDLLWKEKKAALARIQEIYIDKSKWDEQEKLIDPG